MRSKTPRRLGGPEPPRPRKHMKHSRKVLARTKSLSNSDAVNTMIEEIYPEYRYEDLNDNLSGINGEYRLDFKNQIYCHFTVIFIPSFYYIIFRF
jgi:hypothetical protein